MKAKSLLFYLVSIIYVILLCANTAFPETEEAIPKSGDIFLLDKAKLVEMDYVAGHVINQSSAFSSKIRFAIIAEKEHSKFKIKETKPIFYSRVQPSEINIVRFDIDTYKGKLARYVMVTASRGSTAGDVPEENKIEFDYKKEPNGLYKLTLQNTLERGEYGIILAAGSTKYRIFDFSIGEP